MKKIFQRSVDAGKGDCMKCTIATLLSFEFEGCLSIPFKKLIK